AAIDISDGLAGDLGHVLRASGVGAEMVLADLPQPAAVAALPAAQRLNCVLQGGDDYELAFTAPVSARDAVRAASDASNTPVQRIGRVKERPGLWLIDQTGQPQAFTGQSFDHFN